MYNLQTLRIDFEDYDYIVNGRKFTEHTDEFQEEFNQLLMWTTLSE